MPTLFFLLYLLAVGAAYLLRLSYLGWFGPYLFACVVAVPLFSVLLALPAMLTLRPEVTLPETIAKGSSAALRITFKGASFLPLCRVAVGAEIENRFIGERWHFHGACHAPSGEEIVIPLPAEMCGKLTWKITALDCTDLLGLIRIHRRMPELRPCTVLPRPVGPKNAPDLDAALDSSPSYRPKYGGGFSEEHDLREYRPGDSSNSIHWKLSSKSDKLIVREALDRENSRIYLILARVGQQDRGLEVLFWLSCELCRKELPHTIVSDRCYEVESEADAVRAFQALLSVPMGEPCRVDTSKARCVFRIRDGEVFLS